MSNELTALIDKLVTEKTFSVDGVKAIEQLRARAAAQDDKIKSLEEALKSKTTLYDKLDEDRKRLGEVVAAAEKKEAEIVAREAKVFEHEKNAAVAQATAQAMTLALTTVFKPNQVRENVFRSIPMMQPYSGGGAGITSAQQSENITREESA